MTDIPQQLRTIREHLHTGALGQREVWEKWLDEAIDELHQLTGSKAALQTEIERLRELNDDQQAEINVCKTEGEQRALEMLRLRDGNERRECEYLALIEKHATDAENLRKQIGSAEQMVYDSGFRLGEAHKEIARLQESNGAMANLVRRLQAERHTTKRMLKDILDKHGYSGWDAARSLTDDRP